ncbi:MAG: heterodisulfide reductase-related iron-sulfur binding cluster [Pseudomonadota bacterium]
MIPDPLLRETDRCVKCGLCLPHCPTYLKLSNEADSPRGRIALIQAVLCEELRPTPGLRAHLDRCLGCRACEIACPSGVVYGDLIDGIRARIRQDHKQSPAGLKPWLLNILSSRTRLRKISHLLPSLRRGRLLHFGQMLVPTRTKQLFKVATLLPNSAAEPALYPAKRPTGKSLQLFIGCVSSKADYPAIHAAIQVLTRLGFAVEIPAKQTCCGALHRHNGFTERAEQMCARNRLQTETSGAEALITLASACHLELSEHEASRLPVENITDFLLKQLNSYQQNLALAPLAARVAVHIPCSARRDRTIGLLERVPQLEVFALPDNNLCCGAAGSYLLTQPKLSNALGEDKLTLLKSTAPDILVTSNTGCSIQFQLQVQQAKLPIEVLHPIELINRLLLGGEFQP